MPENKILIEVFDGSPISIVWGGLPDSCGATELTEEATAELFKILNAKYGNRLEVKYIDTDLKAYGTYPQVDELAQQGSAFPLVFINQEFFMAGGIDAAKIQSRLEVIAEAK